MFAPQQLDSSRTRRISLCLAIALLLAAERTALGAAELEGQIRGRVVEAATGLPVPGATLTVTSPNLGDPRVVTTDEDGEYLVPNLPIGDYRVTVSYPGVKPMTREVLVQPGTTTPLNIKWSAELAEAETTEVVEERWHLTNPDSTQTGAVLSIEQFRFVPTARTYTDVSRMTPGVTRNPAGVDPFIMGGRRYHNRYLIDGLDVTDPVTRQAQQQLAFESIDSVQVITGGFDAEYNVIGGIINTITREGTDEWHGNLSFYGQNASLTNESRRPLGNTTYEGTRVFSDTPLESTYSYSTSASIGGPIIKHRLWFNVTFQYNYSQTGRNISGPLNVPHVPQYDRTYLPRLKITWAPSPIQRIGLSLAGDPEIIDNTSGGGGRLSTYETHTSVGGYNAILNWSIFPNPNFEFRLDTGIRTQYEHTGPQGWFGDVDTRDCENFSERNCHYDREAPSHQNDFDGSVWLNANSDYSENDRTSFQFDPKITLRGRLLGEHNAKIGIQFRYFLDKNYQHQTGLIKYLDNGGGPGEEGLCEPEFGKTLGCFQRNHSDDRKFTLKGLSSGLFLQDHWRVLPWLTLTPGIRFDFGQVRNPDGTPFLSQFAIGPRMGLVVDITRDQKTIFSTMYGRANEFPYLGFARDYLLTSTGAKVQEKWDPPGSPNGQWVFVSQVGGEGGSIIDKNAKVPHSDAITTSLRREIFRNTVATLEHTWKRITDTWDSFETNVIWDRTGYRILDYVDGRPHEISLYTTTNQNTRNYQGFTLAFEGRPTPNWYLLASYTLSWLWGTGWNDPGHAHRIPQQFKFENGWQPEDTRHWMNIAASYTFNFGLTIGGRLEYNSGLPRDRYYIATGLPDTNKNINRRTPRGTTPGNCAGTIPGQGSFIPASTECDNDVGRIAEYRTPPRAQLDLQLSYDFYILLRQHISLVFYVNNIFNDRTPYQLNENDANSGTFGQVGARYGALSFRLGARYDF